MKLANPANPANPSDPVDDGQAQATPAPEATVLPEGATEPPLDAPAEPEPTPAEATPAEDAPTEPVPVPTFEASIAPSVNAEN